MKKHSIAMRVAMLMCMLCFAQLLMAPSGGIEGCVGFYSYTECKSGATRECYTGPPATKTVAPCKAGTQTCKDDSTWGECVGQVLPDPNTPNSCVNKSEECSATKACPTGQTCNNGKCESNTPQTKIVASGIFVGASGHSTSGKVEITEENGKQTIVLKDDFKTDSGPDLHVYAVNDEKGNVTNDNYLDLGKIQMISGTQTYPLPDGKAISAYKSIVIWCEPFRVNFGYATLTTP